MAVRRSAGGSRCSVVLPVALLSLAMMPAGSVVLVVEGWGVTRPP